MNRRDLKRIYRELQEKMEEHDKDENEEKSKSVHRGISKRHFTRRFTLADEVVVNSAELKNGMLVVDLEKIVPEAKKPRTIKIK